jgi:hypothetical protein
MHLRRQGKRVNYATNDDDEDKENIAPPPPLKRPRGRPRKNPEQLQAPSKRASKASTQASTQASTRASKQPLVQRHPNLPTTNIVVANPPRAATTIKEKLISLLQQFDQKKNGEKGPHGRHGARKNPKDLAMLEFTSLESILRIAALGGTIQDMKNRAEQNYRNHPSPRAQLKWLPRFLSTIFNKTLYCLVTHKDVVSKRKNTCGVKSII